MSKLIWDQIGERIYETGVDHGILFVVENGEYGTGVAWNGLSNVTESPSGAEATAIWADNIKYLNLYSAEEFGATIEAYTYPDEFMECDGSREVASGVTIGQQERKSFGFAYRTKIGNDTDGEPVPVDGYKPTADIIIDSTKTDPTKLARIVGIIEGTADTYTLLTTEPDDWATNYTDYYTKTAGNSYVKVTGETAPTFATDTYYSKTPGTDSRLPLPEEVIDIMAAG